MNTCPFVSIIVPVFNAEQNITKLIESLLSQTYPNTCYEIIIVDNNSTDRTPSIVEKFPVTFLCETKTQSSYAARNTGLQRAKGEVLAFIDSDCVAAKDWVEKGVKALRHENADLAGGKMNFIFSKDRTASEIYDAITHLDTGSNIQSMQAAPTVNLFIKTSVIKNIGLFPEVRSGGDMQLTHKAVKAGYKLIFAPQALVFHPTRTFKEMVTKSYRVGTGCIDVLLARKVKKVKIIVQLLRDFLPQSPASIQRCIQEKGTEDMKAKLLEIFIVGYFFRIVRGMGMLSQIGKLIHKREDRPQQFIAEQDLN